MSALFNRPPHLHTFCGSRNRSNWLFHISNLTSLVRCLWHSVTQSISALSISDVVIVQSIGVLLLVIIDLNLSANFLTYTVTLSNFLQSAKSVTIY